MHLIIVESPAKAKTIEGYLGKGYRVEASYGHVRDLSKDNMGIDLANNFAPNYIVIEEKKKRLKELKKELKGISHVYLATDDDREGEAISWHLAQALQLKEPLRIVFQEVTKAAVLEAIKNPRSINEALVEAQQARRILDRIVGFEISPILWKKLKRGLSAGRVQSVAVRLIVEREREIKAFSPTPFFNLKANFETQKGDTFNATLSSRLKDEKEAHDFLTLASTSSFEIKSIEQKEIKQHPSPPFTTSTLQQEASRALGMGLVRTMRLAQQLYEAGHISYMRTDSLNLSQEARQGARKAIFTKYGEHYATERTYKTKTQGAQEAHEAIRPTRFEKSTVQAERDASRLYDLIWSRAMASQMASAVLDRTLLSIAMSKQPNHTFNAKGDVLRFDGFMALYQSSANQEDDAEKGNTQRLPKVAQGEKLELHTLEAKQGNTRPKARYTEATLVRELEERGIGRPSTYAPTIDTIQRREYVLKESRPGTAQEQITLLLKQGKISQQKKEILVGAEKSKLFPTQTGILVSDFLGEHFSKIVDYSFTAQIEDELDKIAKGDYRWQKMLQHFYDTFHPQVLRVQGAEEVTFNKGKMLGTDPKTGKEVHVLIGRYGPFVQLGTTEEGDTEEPKPKRASLRKGQFIENISLEEALDLLRLPKELGLFEELAVVANIGRYGPYVQHDGKFYSLEPTQDPMHISLGEAIEKIKEKRDLEKNRILKTFAEAEDVQVLKGRYGPYIRFKNKNVRIPKDKEPHTLSYKECVTLAAAAKDSPRRKKTAKASNRK